MELREYINNTFPGLILKPSLYYQWDISLHLEFGKGMYQFKSETDELNGEYFSQVYNEAVSIFNDIFSEKDKILLVTNDYHHNNRSIKNLKKMKVYQHYIKNKNLKFKLKQETVPYLFDDEDEAVKCCTSQYSLFCSKQDIRYPLLIKAICNQDFFLKPNLRKKCGIYCPDVFFINVTKNVIFFIYDDRGCEVIASNKESIGSIYNKYNEMIGEYYREEINHRFR
ncbi:DUF3885 domain-containing protein [Anaerobacillus sp. MEB173]|uniref:DUF3885 domain-containing protein n=1 Tax=Anaerobacillus sp. MEB173 TaxID=3383345 RepID=UPI003F8DD2AF